MTFDNIKQRSLIRTGLIDAALLVTACLIPAVSHLLAFPLYKLNPMLMVTMGALLLVESRWNAYLMAILVPFMTCLIVGMPTPTGALCMAIEYAVVVTVITFAMGTRRGFLATFGIAMAATVAGKAAYYLAKRLIIRPEHLIGTSIVLQAVSVIVIAALFAFFMSRRNR